MQELTSSMLKNTLSVAFLIAVTVSAAAQPRIPPKYKASPLEIVKLPHYCWAQYVDQAYAGHPQYSIPKVCGAYTNHFCPGLVGLMQASDPNRSKAERREILRIASENINYTLRPKDIMPPCPIYGDVKAAEGRANSLRVLVQ